MITREDWDSLEVGDTLHLKGHALTMNKFKVTWVDDYVSPAQWTDSGIIVSPGGRTVIEVRNWNFSSIRFDHYQVKNPMSYIEKAIV